MHPALCSSKYPISDVTFMSVIYNCVKAVCVHSGSDTHAVQETCQCFGNVMWTDAACVCVSKPLP